MMTANEALKSHRDLLVEGKQITEQYKSPRQEYIDQLIKLNELHEIYKKTLGESGISQKTYDKAVKEAQKTLNQADFDVAVRRQFSTRSH